MTTILPHIPLPTDEVELAGTTIKITSLSRSQVLKLNNFANNPDEAETFILACGTGITEEEAAEWRNSVDPLTAGKLIDAIILLTGLADDSKNK